MRTVLQLKWFSHKRVDRELHLKLTESPINPARRHSHVFTYSKWLRSLILPQNKRQGALEMAAIENKSDANVSFTSEWFGVNRL